MLTIKSTIIISLLAYIIGGSFITPTKQLRNYSQYVILMIICCISLSIYMNDVLLSTMLVTTGIIFLYSLENKPKNKKTQETSPHKNCRIDKTFHEGNNSRTIPPQSIIHNKENEVATHTKETITNHTKNLKTQSNVFNTLNNDLYYNELGEQFNIQGMDSINGYDKSIYY